MAYNFASAGYHGCFKAEASIDTDALRKAALQRIEAFDPKSWFDHPVVTLLHGQEVHAEGEQIVQTVDAFGKENGRQVLATPGVTDQVIAHVQSFSSANTDLRAPIRAIEDIFFAGELAADLVAAQALDFHKQDGITEIQEAAQALLVERRLNDALYEDEQAGRLSIGRTAAFVGCVSNFSNFLDLCRKVLRNLELGVPVVVLSRSNTTQHMYRCITQLLALLRERGLDPGLCSYVSCSVQEQRRLLAACSASPMYFTGSRAVARQIKEVKPQLVASTGGPNTMLAAQLTPEVAQAARVSSLIEHKGQCTALRHLVLPGATEADVRAVYADAPVLLEGGARESLRRGECAALLRSLAQPVAAGYSELSLGGGAVAVRIGSTPPAELDEQWREAYLDVTAPTDLSEPTLVELAAWLNREQPISLALNCGLDVALQLFERTALVVYTVGSSGAPALTAQARPQDGECFGELPPRHELDSVTSWPVLIPSSTPGYNAGYVPSWLTAHGAEPLNRWGQGCEALLRRCKGKEVKGYCRVLLEYLRDAAVGPWRGCGERTTLFGLQRPPGLVCLRLEKVSGPNLPHVDALFDEAVKYILPFLSTTAKASLVVSLDPFLSFPAFPMLAQQGLRVVRESRDAFSKAEGEYWNIVKLPMAVAEPRYPLAAQFVSKLFPMGHVKSTLPDHQEFLEQFAASAKWLRMASSAAPAASKL